MSNEIKQGDKVRVSKDAPKMYVPASFWTEGNSIVEEIHEGNAAICYESNYVDFRIVVPIKYLLVNVNGVWKKPKTKPKRTRKVDAEAKEAKFKVGDKVFYVCSPTIKHKCTVTKVTQNEHSGKYEYNVMFEWGKPGMYLPESDLEPYTEPTEQTEAEKKPNVGSITIPVEVDLTDSYWDAYAADLAKEVAVKVANKYNDPEQAAEYAVSVAKAVVEGLKRK